MYPLVSVKSKYIFKRHHFLVKKIKKAKVKLLPALGHKRHQEEVGRKKSELKILVTGCGFLVLSSNQLEATEPFKAHIFLHVKTNTLE